LFNFPLSLHYHYHYHYHYYYHYHYHYPYPYHYHCHCHYHQPLLPQFYQRPAPNGAQDIGTWMTIFQVLSIAAVVTNGALICFTMDVLWDRFSLAGRLWYVLSPYNLLFSQL
jgi:hypothetical protein